MHELTFIKSWTMLKKYQILEHLTHVDKDEDDGNDNI